ncbi:MAG TPA: DUF3472 domain-containing protein [Mucilaginibacter sp.]|jgi:hypothetical protein|nr:DUF3472 domain-containing protein [Mucilaginibacter sp.]
MSKNKPLLFLLATIFIGITPVFAKYSRRNNDISVTVPMGGNAWRVDKDTLGGNISNAGIVNWSSKKAEFVAYVRLAKTGNFKLWLNLKVPGGQSTLTVTGPGSTKQVIVRDNVFSDHFVGEWTVKDTGYVAIKIKALSKTGTVYADIASMKLSGAAVDQRTAYVKNNDGDFFYWGRRGPSVHLGYLYPEGANVEWFYNEVTVPKGNDVIGSYFMACGFGEGYFGMQVNSPTERHVLFSVWSPFTTDDPKKIPEDQKIKMLKKGPNVHAGEFGSEGSGGQSYLLYNWKAGNTYKFLVQAKPDGSGNTDYTAWFYAPENYSWQLIASFSRPKTSTYLKHLYSFLENFEPEQGTITRKVYFNNAWLADDKGQWTVLNKAHFTIDNTGIKGYRMDYAGGVENGAFYLKNCGFFANYTPRNLLLQLPAVAKRPDADLERLP